MTQNEIKVAIRKTINAPVQEVFKAWANAELLKQWFGHDPMEVHACTADAKSGGEYLIHLRDTKAGSDHIVSGVYEEVIENQRLVFSWRWKDGVDTTRVTIDLKQQNENETLLTLTHQGFSQQEFADKHNQGWTAVLESLANFCG